MVDVAHFLAEARRCRRLARGSDDKTRQALHALAAEYEATAAKLTAEEAKARKT
jgi:hypothetical protein